MFLSGKSDILQQLPVDVESSEGCGNTSYNFPTTEQMRCVFPPNNTQGFGACCDTSEGNIVSGIITYFDVITCRDEEHPTIVTDLGYFSQWITDNIYSKIFTSNTHGLAYHVHDAEDSCHGVHLPEQPHGQWKCKVDSEGKMCHLVCTPDYVNDGGSGVSCAEEGWTPPPESLSCQGNNDCQ